jgi:uncharacterized protein (DUF983 family)
MPPADASAAPPPAHQATLARRVMRAVRRRCPRCGGSGMWRSWLKMNERCAHCGLVFERGEAADFWIGAYLINLVVAELSAVVLVALMWLALGDRLSFNVLWAASMGFALVMPVLFYPFSRTLWLAFDLHFRPSERGDDRG